MKSSHLILVSGILLVVASLPALAASPYYSCSFSGLIGPKDPKKPRTTIAFTGFMSEHPGPLGSSWLMRGNMSDGGGQAHWQGACDKDRYCWIEQKYASGQRKFYSVWIGAQRESKGVRSTDYSGSWGLLQPAGSHPNEIGLSSVCKPVKAASPAAFEALVTKSLGWPASAF